MNQDRVVALVMNDLKNRLHSLKGDGLFLGALHGNMAVLNAIGLHERLEGLREILIHQGANNRSGYIRRV